MNDGAGGRARERWRVGAVVGAVVALACGVIGLAQRGPAHAPLDVVYGALQLFVLESDSLGQPPYGPWLEVARFLAPATTAYAVFEALRALLGGELRRRRVARRRGHAIVCGDAVARELLAGRIRDEQGWHVVVIRDTDEDRVRRPGVDVVRGDPRDEVTLQAAGIDGAAALYACAPTGGAGLAVVLTAARIRAGQPARFDAFAQVSGDEIVDALRARQVGAAPVPGVAVDFFELEDTAARAVLDEDGLAVSGGPIVIVGSAPIGAALVRALARRVDRDGQRRSVVVHTDEPATVTELAQRLGAADRGVDVTVASLSDPVADPNERIFVCLPGEERTLAHALRLLRVPGRHVVAFLSRAAPFADAVDGTDGLRVFGILDEACRPERIEADAVIHRATRAIHRRYVDQRIAAGDTAATNASVRDWEGLPAYLKESNYAQAEHIGVKLREIDATLTAARPARPFAFRAGEIEMLAELEHARWMNERRAAGYVWGPSRTDGHHPDLVDWPDLSPGSRHKDIQAVEYLPELLESVGLYIVRRGAAGAS